MPNERIPTRQLPIYPKPSMCIPVSFKVLEYGATVDRGLGFRVSLTLPKLARRSILGSQAAGLKAFLFLGGGGGDGGGNVGLAIYYRELCRDSCRN